MYRWHSPVKRNCEFRGNNVMEYFADPNEIPTDWYNICADLAFELPPDLPAPSASQSIDLKPQLPLALMRQSLSRKRDIEIPIQVRDRYRSWRPTPLTRAARLEES